MDLKKKKRDGAIAQKQGPAVGGCRLLSTVPGVPLPPYYHQDDSDSA